MTISFPENVDALDFKEQKRIRRDRYESDIKDRQWLAKWAAVVVSVWLAGVLVAVLFSRYLDIAGGVLMALLGTTTLNVLGLTFIVLRGHFHTEHK
jgi:hypothetical protein